MLVPLCVQESKSAKAKSLYQQYRIVVWWGTPVEIASAIARLLRMNLIQASDWLSALKTSAVLAQSWSVVEPSSTLRATAEQLVKNYDLRAGDALQLAAALAWCEGNPNGATFLASDERLLQTAMLIGFDVSPV